MLIVPSAYCEAFSGSIAISTVISSVTSASFPFGKARIELIANSQLL